MEKQWVIVGAGWAGQTIASVLAKNKTAIAGFVDDMPEASTVSVQNGKGKIHFPVLGHSRDLSKIIHQYGVKNAVIAVADQRADHLLSQIVCCQEAGVRILEMPDLYAKLTKKMPVHHLNHCWTLPPLLEPKGSFYTFFYEVMNFLTSLIGFLFVLLPLYPIIATLIVLDSRGPILFQQVRVGKREKPFTLYKFRTMVADAEEDGKAVWAEKGDKRVTNVGRLLRKFRLDELPQFWNVLKGEMALIGPRPERPEFVEELEKSIPFYKYRHIVRPGITGWAQVSYRYGNSVDDALEKLQYDLYWIKNRSLMLDLRIILRSFKVVITGFGAV